MITYHAISLLCMAVNGSGLPSSIFRSDKIIHQIRGRKSLWMMLMHQCRQWLLLQNPLTFLKETVWLNQSFLLANQKERKQERDLQRLPWNQRSGHVTSTNAFMPSSFWKVPCSVTASNSLLDILGVRQGRICHLTAVKIDCWINSIQLERIELI